MGVVLFFSYPVISFKNFDEDYNANVAAGRSMCFIVLIFQLNLYSVIVYQ